MPASQRPMDAPTRALTESQIAQIPQRITAPEGFDPLQASNPDLVKHGYPPRPSKAKNPKLRALWDDIMSRRPEIIDPKLKVGDYVHLPLSRDPLQLAEETDPTMNATSGNWSGAVQTAPPTAAYPPQDMKNSSGTGWIDGTYVEGSWVGLDGWSNGSVFQTGSASQVTVKGGAIVSTSYFAWHEWFPAGYIEYSGLPITGGDFVSAFVWGTAGSNTGYVSFTNLTTNQSTGLLKLTAPPGTFIQGASAEWISEDPTGKFFPNYGAEVFIDCTSSAHTADGQTNSEQTLAGATLVNAVQPPPIGTISTAFEENSTTLYTYAYTDTSGA